MPNDPMSLEKCRAILTDAECLPVDEAELVAMHSQVLLLSEAVVQTYENFRDGVQDFNPQAMFASGDRGFWTLLGFDPDEMEDEIEETRRELYGEVGSEEGDEE